MPAWSIRLLLLFGAVTAGALALAILFLSGPFYAGYSIETDGKVSLLNELKAPALLLLSLGLVQGAGVVWAGWLRHGLLAGALLYLTFGLSRIIAVLSDGPPSSALLRVMAVELLFGLLFGLALWRQRRAGAG